MRVALLKGNAYLSRSEGYVAELPNYVIRQEMLRTMGITPAQLADMELIDVYEYVLYNKANTLIQKAKQDELELMKMGAKG